MKKLRIQEDVGFAIRQNEEITRLQESNGTATKQLPQKLIVEIEAIHNGITKNHTLYTSDELSRSIESWTGTYSRPVLKNHDMHTEPLGRVLSASYGRSKKVPDRETVLLKCEITDPDAIAKVADGRYQTVSVGGTANQAICSVCEKDLISEGYCGHMRGRTYKTKSGDIVKAHYMVKGLEFEEISFVNAPADVHAGVTNTAIADTDNSNSDEVVDETAQEEGVKNVDVNKVVEGTTTETDVTETVDPLDIIDGVAGVSESTNSETDNTAVEEGTVETVSLDEMTASNEDGLSLDEQVTALNTEVTSLTEERDSLKTKVSELTNSVDELNRTVEQKDTEVTSLKEANLQMATYIRSYLIEQVIDYRVQLGLEEEAERESLVNEYKTVSTKMIQKQIGEYKQQLSEKKETRKQRESVAGSVTNPALALHSQDGSEELSESNSDDEGLVTESTKKKEEEFDLNEAVNAMVGYFSKTNY